MGMLSRAAILAASAVAGLSGVSVAGAAVFSGAADIPGSQGSGAHLAVNASGAAAAIWQSTQGAAVLSSRPAATAFGAGTELASAADTPAVAIDGAGRATAAWIARVGPDLLVQARSDGADPVAALSDPGDNASEPVVAADAQGNVTIAWIRGGIVQARKRPAGAMTWDPVVEVGPPAATKLHATAFDGGGVVLAWIVEGNAASSTRVSLTSAWGPVEVHGASTGAVDVAANATGDAAIVWTSANGLRHAHRRGKVIGFDADAGLDAAPAAAYPAVSVGPDGRSTTAWLSGDRVVAADTPAAGPPTAAAPVSGTVTPPSSPAAPPIDVAAGPAGIAAVGWAMGSVNAAFRDRDGAWGAATELAAAGENPELGMAATGDALALWIAARTVRTASAAPAPTPTPTPSAAPSPTPTPGPTPKAGVSALVSRVSGTVTIKVPGAKRFAPLGAAQTIPLGSEIDTGAGRVRLGTAQPSGAVQTADFFEGRFKVGQVKDPKVKGGLLTEVALRGTIAKCKKKRKASTSAAAKKRRLWGDGKGRFRTKGTYSAATVRGTRWLVEDRCDRTLTRVARGVVEVRDTVRKKTVVVKAGKSYTAKRR
jgi:hypothetical protein